MQKENQIIREDSKQIVVFTGGGTGGHIYPNLALIPTMKSIGFGIRYIGSKNSLEQKLCEQNNIPFDGIDAVKLVRSLSISAIKNNICIPHILAKSVKQATVLLKDISPCAIFSKGGFVSLPVVLSAHKLGIPIFAHESDLTLGLANKIAMHLGAHMLKANPHSTFDGDFVGMPLRDELFANNQAIIPKKDIPTILVLGGSLGARAINEAIEKNLAELTSKYFILHVTGKGKNNGVSHKNYMAVEYAGDIAKFYNSADLVISRAGATSVFEISALKKRAIFIPLPKGVSRGDQIYNADLAKEYGATILLESDDLCDKILPTIETALQNLPMKAIQNDSNGKIATLIYDSVRRGEKCKNKKPSPNGLP